jgi:hypothetical protein
MLIGFDGDFRGLKLDEVLIGKGWSRDGMSVRHSVVFEDFFYEVFLGEGDGSLLMVIVYMNV